MAQADHKRDLRPFIIIAVAIVVAAALIAAALMFTIRDAKEEIIDATRAAARADDPFQLDERIDQGVVVSAQESAESALRQAALAQESYRLRNGVYTTSVEDLQAEGLVIPHGIAIAIVASVDDLFCIEADHDMIDENFYYDSVVGEVRMGPEGLTDSCADFRV